MLKKHRSKAVTEGVTRTPHRAFLRATGLDDDDLDRSMVAIIGTAGDNTPCSKSLGPQADSVRLGVAQGGGVPVMMNTISVSDGTSMNHAGMRMSLVSREMIADSMEIAVRGHAYDALVGLGGCDKTLPGTLMAMARLNVPSVFIYGGSMLPGYSPDGTENTVLTAIEGVGRYQTGAISLEQLHGIERTCAMTVGSCPGQFTANTMGMVAEALGLSFLGSSTTPAVYSQRHALARRAGRRVMEILEHGGPLPRDLITRKSLENATAAVAATDPGPSPSSRRRRTRRRPCDRAGLALRSRARSVGALASGRGWPGPAALPANCYNARPDADRCCRCRPCQTAPSLPALYRASAAR